MKSDQEDSGVHDVRVSQRQCPDCGAETFTSQCPDCSSHTKRHYECDDCEIVCEPDESGHVECPQCGQNVTAAGWTTVDLQAEYRDALDATDEREASVEVLKGVQELKSADTTPEAIEKGILRAKHDVSACTDGTARYEMTELPVTAVKPSEIGVTADRLRELGYDTDIDGDPLRHDDQVVELKIQDVVLSEDAAEHMRRTAGFVDDLLERFYELPLFYDIEQRDGLIGELVFGMEPQMSTAVVGRIIGVSEGTVGYAHPYFQAAKYRTSECFEDYVMLLMDGLVNFSRQFLPAKRGGYIDAPLVLSPQIDPTDIDTAVHNMDIVSTHPPEFYEATRKRAGPQSTDIQTVANILDTTDQYHGFKHTHETSNINMGPTSQRTRRWL